MEAAQRALDGPIRDDTRLLIQSDPEWPVKFRSMGDFAPMALWVIGDAHRLQEAMSGREVAITGTRRGSFLGVLTAEQRADEVQRHGCGVIATGQAGIGTGVTTGALETGGRPIVVQPGSPECPKPDERKPRDFERLAAYGVIVSEVAKPIERPDLQGLQRDRLLAGLADAVVVVQVARDSECMWTARYADQVGVPVGAIPVITGQAPSHGCLQLIEEGVAEPVNNEHDIVDLLTPQHRARGRGPDPLSRSWVT